MSRAGPNLQADDRLAELVQSILAGEAKAIERFVLAVGPSVLRAVRRILGTHHPDVEDVAQEAMFGAIHANRAIALPSPMDSATHAIASKMTPASDEAREMSGPADVFSAANAARHAGDLARAIELYRELETKYPQSDEAQLTHMLLGRLELGRGNAGRALLEYERYLESAPNGALAQEALQGKARALHLLGIKDEEQMVWRELLRRFPQSAYAETAREHLSEGP